MKIKKLYTPDIYHKIMEADSEKKNDIYRYEMMMPLKDKWDCYHIPMKADKPGGYDIIMASEMLGLLPPKEVNNDKSDWIKKLSDNELWENVNETIITALERFEKRGIGLKVQEYLYSIFLANPEKPSIKLSDGYCGDGGIPGYILGWFVPTEETIRKLPAAISHEVNHNVRYQYITWKNDITLGEMLVSEGLAENFAVSMYDESFLGPWVTKTDQELMPLIKEIIYEGLGAQGLENITSYLYGDELARLQNYPEVGLPYCAGYATGYYLIKYYLKKTGISIEQATILPADVILREVEEFWTNEI